LSILKIAKEITATTKDEEKTEKKPTTYN